MMGETIPVNLDIKQINGFSGHADVDQLMRRAKGFTHPPRKTFIIHGEGNAQTNLKSELEKIGFTCEIPSIKDQVEL